MDFFLEQNSSFESDNQALSSHPYFGHDHVSENVTWDANMDSTFLPHEAVDYTTWDQRSHITTTPRHSFHTQPFSLMANRPYDPPEILPRAMAVGSPLRYQEQISECSTASPGKEKDLYSDIQVHYQADNTSFSFTPSFNDTFWPTSQQFSSGHEQQNLYQRGHLPYQQHISMNAVQAFQDSQDIFRDEGIGEDPSFSFCLDHDSEATKFEDDWQTHRHATDKAVGQSVKEDSTIDHEPTASVEPEVNSAEEEEQEEEKYIKGEDDTEPESNNEEEDDTDDAIGEAIEDPTEDEDYHPRRISKRKHHSRVSAVPPPSKRAKTAKRASPSIPKNASACQTCSHVAKDALALQRHTKKEHTRPFICTFSFAGCNTTFGSKNEWKRHVSSQHLALKYWRCEEGSCGHVQGPKSKRVALEFNRKDLFTQHLKRMHAPFSVKRRGLKDPDWDEKIKVLQTAFLKTRRKPPQFAICPVKACNLKFKGKNCWDDRMEHVGKHLETAAKATKKDGQPEIVETGDEVLVEWAIRECILERTRNGDLVLLPSGSTAQANDDMDAEGDYE